ncbi:unnamed protein product [Trichobilharzia regenti]|nr:unnamed protein product [Trichobilharzia regenti]
MDEDALIAMVMEQSRREYLESLSNKQKTHSSTGCVSPEANHSNVSGYECTQRTGHELSSEVNFSTKTEEIQDTTNLDGNH